MNPENYCTHSYIIVKKYFKKYKPHVLKFFNGQSAFNEMVSKFRVVKNEREEQVFDYGQPGSEFYIIMKGRVSI